MDVLNARRRQELGDELLQVRTFDGLARFFRWQVVSSHFDSPPLLGLLEYCSVLGADGIVVELAAVDWSSSLSVIKIADRLA